MKPSPRKDKTAMQLSQLAKLWIPFGKKLVLEGVVVAKLIVSSEPQKTIALGTAWQPTFNKHTFYFYKAKNYLEQLCDLGEYCDEFASTYWNYRDAIGKGPNTLPGPDALPYAAWKACGDVGIRSLS